MPVFLTPQTGSTPGGDSEGDRKCAPVTGAARRGRTGKSLLPQTLVTARGFLHLADLMHQKLVIRDACDADLQCVVRSGSFEDGYGTVPGASLAAEDEPGRRLGAMGGRNTRMRRLSRIVDRSHSWTSSGEGSNFGLGASAKTTSSGLDSERRHSGSAGCAKRGSGVGSASGWRWRFEGSVQAARRASRKLVRRPGFVRLSQASRV